MNFIRKPLVHLPFLAATLLLTACGGGGSSNPPTVSGVTLATAMYSKPMVITVNGTNLDRGIAIGGTTCSSVTLLSTGTTVSSSTTAYYSCTVAAVGSTTVTVIKTSDATVLSTTSLVVPLPRVVMAVSNGSTVTGNLTMELYPDKTPYTVTNFLSYVNKGFYNGLIFHRVLPGFVIQGGGFLPFTAGTSPTARPTDAPIPLEVGKGLSNVQWSIAMARTNVSNSATSQFFVNMVNNAATLDPRPGAAGYAVFGTLVAGTDVATNIMNAPCAANAVSDCAPNTNILINTATQTQ